MVPARTVSGLLVVVALAGMPARTRAEAVRATAGAVGPAAAGVTTTVAPRVRAVTDEAFTPFASVGGVVLLHPSSRVEHVGFHQSNNDGARPLTVLPTAVAPVTLEDRERDTDARTAADVVVDPDREIRSPVTGRVKRSGGYVLYCKYHDDYVVIEPDSHPGWEVKVLHIDGVRVRAGHRVVGGTTVIAPGPARLPFGSQVDEVRTADPPWPHVHVEVVDPTIRDRPSPPCT